MPENKKVSGVFRGYKIRKLARNGINLLNWIGENLSVFINTGLTHGVLVKGNRKPL